MAFLVPRQKPAPYWQLELDTQAPLARGLQCLLLFDRVAGLRTADCGFRDYAHPNRAITAIGTMVFTRTANGGAYSTTTTTSALVLNPTITSTAWTLSHLVKFTGVNPASDICPCSDGADGTHYYVEGTGSATPGCFSFNGGNAAIGALRVSTLNGWFRITATWDGTTQTMYSNGVSFGSTAAALPPTVLKDLCGDATVAAPWQWQTADFFYWSRALSAGEVLAHYASPYGSVMRPRYSERFRGRANPPNPSGQGLFSMH
jgi:hypothetical protein